MKKNIFIVFLILSFILVGCTKKEETKELDMNKIFDPSLKVAANYGYDNLPTDNMIFDINIDTILEMIVAKKSFILFVGMNSCPHCQDFIPIVNDVAEKMDQPVVYLNFKRHKSEGISVEKVDQFMNDYSIETVPKLFAFKDGKLVSNIDGFVGDEMAIRMLFDNIK